MPQQVGQPFEPHIVGNTGAGAAGKIGSQRRLLRGALQRVAVREGRRVFLRIQPAGVVLPTLGQQAGYWRRGKGIHGGLGLEWEKGAGFGFAEVRITCFQAA